MPILFIKFKLLLQFLSRHLFCQLHSAYTHVAYDAAESCLTIVSMVCLSVFVSLFLSDCLSVFVYFFVYLFVCVFLFSFLFLFLSFSHQLHHQTAYVYIWLYVLGLKMALDADMTFYDRPCLTV